MWEEQYRGVEERIRPTGAGAREGLYLFDTAPDCKQRILRFFKQW